MLKKKKKLMFLVTPKCKVDSVRCPQYRHQLEYGQLVIELTIQLNRYYWDSALSHQLFFN